jgi:hypothetical protein
MIIIFLFGENLPKCEKINLKEYFCHKFLEILKKIAKKVEVLS